VGIQVCGRVEISIAGAKAKSTPRLRAARGPSYFAKMGVRDRAQAAAYAYRHGLARYE
jgi:hypothetical protein